MIEVTLTRGKTALIDDEDWPLVSRYKWHAHFWRGRWYARTAVYSPQKTTFLQMHRLIASAVPGQMVDHRNDDGLDNRRENLRLCNNPQNQQNAGPRGGSSKYKGVSWYARREKWRVAFNWNGKTYFVGYFDGEDEAALAYNDAILPLAGAFARLNVVA